LPNGSNNCGAFRWVETEITASGIKLPQTGAGVGVSSRIPAVLKLPAKLEAEGRRLTTLNVAGIGRVDLRRILAEGQAIADAELASWFDSKWLSPTIGELHTLATALNVMRVTIRLEDGAKLRADVKRTIGELLGNLPQLIQQQQQDFEAAPRSVGATTHGLTILRAFNELLVAATSADKFLGRVAPPRRVSAWFSDALWLATFVRMLGERARKQIGLTNAESPAVHFIVRALKRAIPEEPVNPENVARTMDRHKKLFEPLGIPL